MWQVDEEEMRGRDGPTGRAKKFVNTNFFQLQKIKQLKRNMVCKYNLYWCIMSTISILILLQNNTLWFYLLWSRLKQWLFLTLVERWIEWFSQQISSFELIQGLLFFKFFKPFECSILQVIQRFLRQNFFRTWASWKLGVQNERRCPLFIVISEDKLHFKLIYFKVCSRLLISPNSS